MRVESQTPPGRARAVIPGLGEASGRRDNLCLQNQCNWKPGCPNCSAAQGKLCPSCSRTTQKLGSLQTPIAQWRPELKSFEAKTTHLLSNSRGRMPPPLLTCLSSFSITYLDLPAFSRGFFSPSLCFIAHCFSLIRSFFPPFSPDSCSKQDGTLECPSWTIRL